MQRLSLSALALLCCAWTQAVPTPTPAPQYYAMNVVQMGSVPSPTPSGPTPTATPTATPGGAELWLEDCTTAIDAVWTDTSAGIAFWAIDGTTCQTDGQVGKIVEILSPSATAAAAFCSFPVTDAGSASTRLGCSFRAQGTPGEHIEVFFDNAADRHRTFHREDDHSDSSGIDNMDAACTCTYTNYVATDVLGITFDGTVAGNDTSINMWINPTGDPQDPSGWGAADCACSDAEIAASDLVWIDTNGKCGLLGRYVTQGAGNQPNIDNFACGDQP